MEITRSGSRPSGKGPTEYFTGAVRIDPLFEAPDPARVRAASVTFEPGAHRLAHPPAGPNPDRDGWVRLCTMLEWFDRGDSSGGRDLVGAGGETLAWRCANHCHDPYRPSGSA